MELNNNEPSYYFHINFSNSNYANIIIEKSENID